MNKKIILFLLILISVCSISHVSATDDAELLSSDDAEDIQTQSIEETTISQYSTEDTVQVNDENIVSDNDDDRNIQSKINNASEGDTIELEGEYICDYIIKVNKTVKIVGVGNGATIKANKSNPDQTPFFVIDDSASNVVLENLTFIGGDFIWGTVSWHGDNGVIRNCKFTNNAATGDLAIGGAVMALADNITIEKCVFTNNKADWYGGAVFCNGTLGLISECEFIANSAINNKSHGGAITLWGSNYTIRKSNFTDNHVSDYGGAISVLKPNNIISDCIFMGNYVTNTLDKNLTQGGGAVYSLGGLTVDNCNFTANRAELSLGGAISLYTNDTVTHSYFRDNFAIFGNDLYGPRFKEISNNTFVIDFDETLVDALMLYDKDKNQSYDEASLKKLLNEYNNILVKIKRDSSVHFSAGMIFQYAASGSITVKVEGGHIELKDIHVLGQPNAKITFENGLLTVSNLPVGKYTLRVTTTPDENYTAVDGDLSITVNKATAAVKASKITVALKSGTKWTVKIIDSRTNNPITGMKITLKVYTGKKYKTVTLTTNANGEASYNTKSLAAGTHKISASGSHNGYNLNSFSSSVKVVKQTALKFKLQSKKSDKGGALLSYLVLNKKTKKGINGVKLKVMIYTGKKYKTYILKTKKIKGKKKTYMGAFGFATNDFSAGTHKVVIQPTDIKYKGTVKTSIKISKKAAKAPKYFRKV